MKLKNDHKDDYLEFLENNAAPIEYIDSIESEYCFISKDIYSILIKIIHIVKYIVH